MSLGRLNSDSNCRLLCAVGLAAMIPLVFVPLMLVVVASGHDESKMPTFGPGLGEPLADGGPMFEYNDAYVRDRTTKMDLYLTNHQANLTAYLDTLRANQNISLTKQHYLAVLAQVKNSSEVLRALIIENHRCQEDIQWSEDIVKRQKDIHQIVEQCFTFCPRQRWVVLVEKVTATKKACQIIDQKLKFIERVCSQDALGKMYTVARNLCVYNWGGSLDKLEAILAKAALELGKLATQSLEDVKEYVEPCVKRGIEVALVNIGKQIEHINTVCKGSESNSHTYSGNVHHKEITSRGINLSLN